MTTGLHELLDTTERMSQVFSAAKAEQGKTVKIASWHQLLSDFKATTVLMNRMTALKIFAAILCP